jgi:hypothetical protein
VREVMPQLDVCLEQHLDHVAEWSGELHGRR